MKRHLAVLTAFLLSTGFASAVLVAQYTFDNSGDLGADSSGNANDGTLSGTPAVTGVNDVDRGAVLELSGGATGYIHAPISLSGSGFTIMAWVKSDSWSNNRGVFQVQPTAGGTVNNGTKVVGAWVGNAAPGQPWGRVRQSNGSQLNLPQTGPSLSTNQWYHLTYRGDGSTYEVFIDGSNVGTASLSYDGTLETHSTLILGRQGGEAWDGRMDDFRVYTNALSNQEIADIAAGIPEPSSTVLIGGIGLLALLRRRR